MCNAERGRAEARIRRVISASTRLVALLGHPVAHSLSPRMQNAAFAARGLDWAYVASDVLARGARGGCPRPRRPGLRRRERHGAAQARRRRPGGERRAVREHARVPRRADRGALDRHGDPRRAAGGASRRPRRRRRGGRLRAGAAARAALRPPRRVAPGCVGGRPGRERDARRATMSSSSSGRARRSSTSRTRRRRPRAPRARAGATVVGGLEALVAQGAASFELWTGVPAPLRVMRAAVGLSGL